MKKRAFTMVELIFVIVILGILAAVAVPKLNASRADAQKAVLKANIKTAITDIDNYFIAQGTFASYHAEDHTSVPLEYKSCGDGGFGASFIMVQGAPCLGFGALYSSGAYLLRTTKALVDAAPMCKEALQSPEIKKLLDGYNDAGGTKAVNLVDLLGASAANDCATIYKIPGKSAVEFD